MKLEHVIEDIKECFEFMGPECTAGVIQQYINAKNDTSYNYSEVYELLNYHSFNNRPFFSKRTLCNRVVFKLMYP